MRIWLSFCAALLFLVSAVRASDPARPNIVVILADDLGYGDVQSYNRDRGRIPTPHIDRLAAAGMRFTDGHSSSGVCSPSRYSLLTGRYHWRTRLQAGIVGMFEAPLIAPDRMTLASLLKAQGYQTACIGKWHLGWNWPIPGPQRALFYRHPAAPGDPPTSEQRQAWAAVFSKPIPGGPTTRGFDEYFGTDVPNWPPYCFIENDRTVGIPSGFLRQDLLGNYQASIQGPALPDWTLEPILPALQERSCRFIEQSAKAASPFFLYLPLTAPHTPLAVNESWREKSGLNSAYADLVMETDAVVGAVLTTLETSGVAGNTLVVFTSDNGCAPYIGAADLEKQGHYPSGPFRGYKADAWEGGHRVPFIIRWPGQVQAGSECSQTVGQTDLLATFADVLNVKLPENAGEDSVSLLSLLKGQNQPVHEAVIHHSSKGCFAVRSGRWKLQLCPGSGGGFVASDTDAAAIRAGLPGVQLYDLLVDPGETNNLQAQHREEVARLTKLIERLIADGRSTPGPAQKNAVPIRLRKDSNPQPRGKAKKAS